MINLLLLRASTLIKNLSTSQIKSDRAFEHLTIYKHFTKF